MFFPTRGFKVGGKYELYSNLSVTESGVTEIAWQKDIGRLESHSKDSHTTRLDSLDSEVCDIKMSLLELYDKVSTVTFMLDTFMKDMKGMVVEEVTVEEEPVEKDKEVSKEEEATQKGKIAEEEEKKEEEEKEAEKEENPEEIDATPIQTISQSPVKATPITTSPRKPKASKKRKTRSRK